MEENRDDEPEPLVGWIAHRREAAKVWKLTVHGGIIQIRRGGVWARPLNIWGEVESRDILHAWHIAAAHVDENVVGRANHGIKLRVDLDRT